MSIPGSGSPLLFSADAAAAAGYEIERSLRFNNADSAYLNKTFGSTGTTGTTTFSTWVKRCRLGAQQSLISVTESGSYSAIQFNDDDKITMNPYNTAYGVAVTNAVFRDPSAWYHVVVVIDTGNGTSTDRLRIYVNGVRQAVSSYTAPSSGTLASANEHKIGVSTTSTQHVLGAYLADVYMIDGQALEPTSFGEFDATTGVWNPIAYSGSYGTNGFHLDFSDNSSASALGTDSSGNSNNWTPNNFSVTAGTGNDSLFDSPTNGTQTDNGAGGEISGNYCVWNPNDSSGNAITISNGNLDTTNTTATYDNLRGTLGMSSGKWYWEVEITSFTGGFHVGLAKPNANLTGSNYVGGVAGTWAYGDSGNKYAEGTSSSYGSSFASVGSKVGVAFNADAGSVFFYLNGSSQGVAFTGLTDGPYLPAMYARVGNTGGSWNFGQRDFEAGPNTGGGAPSGYKALCTANFDTPTIEDPSTVMDVALNSGGSILNSTKSLCDGNANFLWIKDRANSGNHSLIDIVRDPQLDGTPFLASNSALDEGSLGTYSAPAGSSVGWAWYAGASNATNNSGTITSTVRANISAGFSVVTYAGAEATRTVGHGLGVAPQLMIHKARNAAEFWLVYHASIGATKQLNLSSTAAAATTTRWNNTAPTSSVFTVTDDSAIGGPYNYVTYCWTPVEGYSAFGSYSANGSSDGPFVFCNFRPKVVILKKIDTTENWIILDAARDSYNETVNNLFPNRSNAEQASAKIDILSNGFKLRSTTTGGNTSGGTYAYMAWAESPFAYARAR